MNSTHPLVRRIVAGIGFSAASVLIVAGAIVPGGAMEGRAASLRMDEPTTTTTTVPVQPVAPAPEPTTTTTTVPVAAPAPAATTVTTAIDQPLVVERAKAQSGHYVCPAGMDATTQYDSGPDCQADDTVDPGPVNASPDFDPALPSNPDGDVPGQTLGSTDAAYGAQLADEACTVKPWLCDDGYAH